MKEIIPTIIPESFDDLTTKIAHLRSFAHAVHIDAADGRFVPNTTWLPQEEDQLPATSALLFEAHLMVEEPLQTGISFAKAGASRIIAHFESFSERSEIAPAFEAWRGAGAQEIGLALKIETPIEDAAPFFLLADSILIMTIPKIGMQGNTFDVRGLERIRAVTKQFPLLPIAADGGINETNTQEVARAGASRICAGSALALAHDPAAVYQRLVAAANAV